MASKVLYSKARLWYFVTIFSIIPILDFSGLTTLINRVAPIFAGNYNILVLILSLPFLQQIRNYKGLGLVVLSLYILTAFTLIHFFYTAINTSAFLALQVFRKSFIGPLNVVILLPFLMNLRKEEFDYVWKALVKVLLVFGLLYISNNLGFDWMGTLRETSGESRGGYTVLRNIIGLPPIESIWLGLAIVTYCIKVPKSHWWLMLILICLFLSYTRNLFACACVSFVVISVLLVVKKSAFIGRLMSIVFFLFLFLTIVSIFNPSGLGFWEAKLSNTIYDEMVNDTGTFSFRESLIEQALDISGESLFGIGYVRDAGIGEYSIVMGGDTYWAAIIICEGYFGIVLRSVCYLSLLVIVLHHFFRSHVSNSLMDIVIVSTIVASAVNYVQTKALTNYLLFWGMMIVAWLRQYNHEDNNKDNQLRKFSNNYTIWNI